MATITKQEKVDINDLKPYRNNAKIHDKQQVEQIANSIQEFGFISPILIDKDFNIIAGHGRVMAAKKLGMKEVPAVFIEGLTDAQRRAYILADNRLTELGEWNADIISEELKQLQDDGFDLTLTGFTIDDITIDDFEDIEPTMEDLEDQQEEDVPEVHRGDIYILGNHRLMVGDSTKREDVLRLTKGEQMDLLETDPPYNVAYENTDGDTIENDDLPTEEFIDFLSAAFINAEEALKPGGAFYIWHASMKTKEFIDAMENAGLEKRAILVWVKNSFTLGRGDYQWRHEPCFYGWKAGGAHYFIDLRSLSTVQEYDTLANMSKDEIIEKYEDLLSSITTIEKAPKPTASEIHPTAKPLSLIKKHIRNSSQEGENVLDLFGGSGTTLIACEEMNRRCYMMEYDPKYAARIIKRWEDETGKKATKEIENV